MRMKALIDDLLELERLGAKSFPVDVQPVESRDLLEEALTDAQPLADAKHISLVLDLIDPPKIHADPHRISQVLSNLLGNSIKFTPEGGTVTLRARSRDGVLWATIADTGRGIAPNIWRTYSIAIGDPGDRKERERASGSTSRGESWRRMADACGPSLLPMARPSSSRCRSNPAATEPLTLACGTVAGTLLASKEPRPTATWDASPPATSGAGMTFT